MLRPMALGVRPRLAAADTTEMGGTDIGADCRERGRERERERERGRERGRESGSERERERGRGVESVQYSKQRQLSHSQSVVGSVAVVTGPLPPYV